MKVQLKSAKRNGFLVSLAAAAVFAVLATTTPGFAYEDSKMSTEKISTASTVITSSKTDDAVITHGTEWNVLSHSDGSEVTSDIVFSGTGHVGGLVTIVDRDPNFGGPIAKAFVDYMGNWSARVSLPYNGPVTLRFQGDRGYHINFATHTYTVSGAEITPHTVFSGNEGKVGETVMIVEKTTNETLATTEIKYSPVPSLQGRWSTTLATVPPNGLVTLATVVSNEEISEDKYVMVEGISTPSDQVVVPGGVVRYVVTNTGKARLAESIVVTAPEGMTLKSINMISGEGEEKLLNYVSYSDDNAIARVGAEREIFGSGDSIVVEANVPFRIPSGGVFKNGRIDINDRSESYQYVDLRATVEQAKRAIFSPSNGDTIDSATVFTGIGLPEDRVVITDADDEKKVYGETTVDEDGNWELTLAKDELFNVEIDVNVSIGEELVAIQTHTVQGERPMPFLVEGPNDGEHITPNTEFYGTAPPSTWVKITDVSETSIGETHATSKGRWTIDNLALEHNGKIILWFYVDNEWKLSRTYTVSGVEKEDTESPKQQAHSPLWETDSALQVPESVDAVARGKEEELVSREANNSFRVNP